MESIGIININVEKKFMKLWYKKKKITLQDMYLSKQVGPIGAPVEILAGKIIAEFKVALEVKPIEPYKENPQEGHKKEAKETIDSKAHHVEESKLEKLRAKVDVYHQPHQGISKF
jgi:hypothetical protein